jgi:integrase
MPWSFIADGTRWVRETWDTAEDVLRETARTYRRNLWRGQGMRIEIWLEKDALGSLAASPATPTATPPHGTGREHGSRRGSSPPSTRSTTTTSPGRAPRRRSARSCGSTRTTPRGRCFRSRSTPNRHKPGEKFTTEYRDQPVGVHGLHKWWYACIQRAGVVAKGQTSGERMHKARHTVGQRVLDATHGNLKAVQKLLGHSSISTTADIYTDWDIDQLTETLRSMHEESER